MDIEVQELTSSKLIIIKHGNNLRGIFFLFMGLLFQILFLWMFWSFLDTTGPWAYFWLGLIYSDFFPFTSVLIFFGGACIVIAIRDLLWKECWIIDRELTNGESGIEKQICIFRWKKILLIQKVHITSICVHKIPLDSLQYFNQYRLELDYQINNESPVKKEFLYQNDKLSAAGITLQLAKKILDILELDLDIEQTEALKPVTIEETFNNRKEKKKEDI